MKMPRVLPGLVAACACAGAPAAAPAATVPGSSQTARVFVPTVARAAPGVGARPVMRLHSYTAFSRVNQVLMVTGEATDPAGRRWVRVALPKRPNGASGWVPASHVALKTIRVRIRVRLGARTLEIWRSGRRVFQTRVGVGTGATPTPRGSFAVQDPVPTLASERPVYGPYIITLTAYSNVLRSFLGGNGLVAIHGTSDRSSIGRAVSHGCIRVPNGALRRVRAAAAAGVPVDIVR